MPVQNRNSQHATDSRIDPKSDLIPVAETWMSLSKQLDLGLGLALQLVIVMAGFLALVLDLLVDEKSASEEKHRGGGADIQRISLKVVRSI